MSSTSVLKVRSAQAVGSDVRVVFMAPYLIESGERLSEKGARTFARLAELTNGCEIRRADRYTVVLMGQHGNERVNSTLTLIQSLQGAGVRLPESAKVRPVVPARRQLIVDRYMLWRGRGDQAVRITSLRECGDVPVTVDVQLSIDGGFAADDMQRLHDLASNLPEGDVLRAEGTHAVFMRYRSGASSDTALANEVGELMELLVKAF